MNHVHAALTQYSGEQPWTASLVRATHAYLLGLAGQEYPVQRREFLGKPQLVSGQGGPPTVGWYEITDRWEGIEEDVLRLTSDGDVQWRASELKAQSASLRQRAAEIGHVARGILYWPYLAEDCPYVDERLARPGSS